MRRSLPVLALPVLLLAASGAQANADRGAQTAAGRAQRPAVPGPFNQVLVTRCETMLVTFRGHDTAAWNSLYPAAAVATRLAKTGRARVELLQRLQVNVAVPPRRGTLKVQGYEGAAATYSYRANDGFLGYDGASFVVSHPDGRRFLVTTPVKVGIHRYDEPGNCPAQQPRVVRPPARRTAG